MRWYRLTAGFGLYFSEVIPHARPGDANLSREEIDIAPPECEEFGPAKAGRTCQHYDATLAQRQFRKKCFELCRGEPLRENDMNRVIGLTVK